MSLSRSDIQMINRAVAQRWNIDDKYKAGLVHRLLKIIADPSSSDRVVVAAAKAVISMEKQNQDDEHKLVDIRIQQNNDRMDVIARELGIDPSLIADDRAKEIGDSEGNEEL